MAKQTFSDFALKSSPLTGDYIVGYDSSTGNELRSTIDSIVQTLLPLVQTVPTGTIITYGASAPPPGYLACDGQQYSITERADLYAVIGTTYGGSPGFFNVPDLQGYFVRGWDNEKKVDVIDGTYTQSSFTVTVDTNTPHGLAGGNSVVLTLISGNGATTSGTFTVGNAPTPTRFIYQAAQSQETSGNVVLASSRLFGKPQNDGLRSHSHSVTDPGHTHTGNTNTAGAHAHRVPGQVVDGSGPAGNSDPQAVAGNRFRTTTTFLSGDHSHALEIVSNTTGMSINSSGTASETRPKNIALLYCIKY